MSDWFSGLLWTAKNANKSESQNYFSWIDFNWGLTLRLNKQVMECSAKTNSNVKEIYKAFLQLARIPLPSDEGLRRRSSAQARVPNGKPRFSGNTTLSPNHGIVDAESSSGSSLGQRLKPRSRSLIRRTSKKVNKNREPASDADDCAVSWLTNNSFQPKYLFFSLFIILEKKVANYWPK